MAWVVKFKKILIYTFGRQTVCTLSSTLKPLQPQAKKGVYTGKLSKESSNSGYVFYLQQECRHKLFCTILEFFIEKETNVCCNTEKDKCRKLHHTAGKLVRISESEVIKNTSTIHNRNTGRSLAMWNCYNDVWVILCWVEDTSLWESAHIYG